MTDLTKLSEISKGTLERLKPELIPLVAFLKEERKLSASDGIALGLIMAGYVRAVATERHGQQPIGIIEALALISAGEAHAIESMAAFPEVG